VSFHLYAAIVKNLRGVVYSEASEEEFEEKIKWLVKRFRYRNLGYIEDLAKKYPIIGKYEGKPFIKLHYPITALKELLDKIGEEIGAGAKHVAVASIYVSPIFIVGEEAFKSLKSICVDCIKTNKELSDKNWKLHMRIADYTTLDFYSWSTQNSAKIIELWLRGGDFSKLIEERLNKIKNDKKRYWRIISESGKPIIVYIDLIQYLVKNNLLSIVKDYRDLAPAALAIVSGIVLT